MTTSDDIERRRAAGRRELEDLLGRGIVQKVLLLPAEFGGTEDPRNVTWLPLPSIAEENAFDSAVRQRIQCGEAVRYGAMPTYEGDSMIPDALRLVVAGRETAECVVNVKQSKTWKTT